MNDMYRPIPVSAPSLDEDTDDAEGLMSQRVDERVDALDPERDAVDGARYREGMGDRGAGLGRDLDETVGDSADDADDVGDHLRRGMDDVTDHAREAPGRGESP